MVRIRAFQVLSAAVISSAALFSTPLVRAQDVLPADNGIGSYHTAPRYRESESHPLRVIAYVLHPVGWLAREVIFRPFSYLAGSTETTRSIFGYREPFDFRQPECFSSDDSVPDCRSVMPFNYEAPPAPAGAAVDESAAPAAVVMGDRQVYFPDLNFDFNKRVLNDLGQGRAHQVAQLLKSSGPVQIVLQGHADFKGSDEYNQKLGMDRAEAVRGELVSLGVPADRLSTVSFGESQPVFADESDWARAVNRRVEVHADQSAAVKE